MDGKDGYRVHYEIVVLLYVTGIAFEEMLQVGFGYMLFEILGYPYTYNVFSHDLLNASFFFANNVLRRPKWCRISYSFRDIDA